MVSRGRVEVAAVCAAVAGVLACGGGGSGAASIQAGGGSDAGPLADGGGQPVERTLTVLRSGSGSVRSSPAGVDCGGACSFAFAQGVQISLSAVADAGWTFAGWSGACGGAGTCTITLAADATVYATFELAAPAGGHRLSVARAGDGAGRVFSSPAGIDCGTTCAAAYAGSPSVTLTAAAEAGSQFSGWSAPCAGTATCTLTVDRDLSVTATFAKKPAPPPADECAGFAPPAPPDPTVLQAATEQDHTCLPGIADGSGNVAFGSTRYHGTDFTFATRSASSRSDLRFAERLNLIGEADGFEGVNSFGDGATWSFLVLAPDGATRSTASSSDSAVRAQFAVQANDPTGGVIVSSQAVFGGTYSPGLIAFDAAGTVRWRTQVAAFVGYGDAAFAVDRRGNTLLLFHNPSGTTDGQWVDHVGAAGPVFHTSLPYGTSRALYARVSSGLFYRSAEDGSGSSSWIAQFDSLATTAGAPPAWLAARPDSRVAMTHGGRAYAVLPNPGRASAPDCSQTIEVVGPSGKSCGAAKFSIAQSACTTLSIDIGYDGTVLQQLPTAMEKQAQVGPVSCTMRWWSGFFR